MKIMKTQLKQIIKEEMELPSLERGAELFDAYKEKALPDIDHLAKKKESEKSEKETLYDVGFSTAESDLRELIYKYSKMGLNPPEEEIIKTIQDAFVTGAEKYDYRHQHGDGSGMYRENKRKTKMKITNSQLKQIIKEELEKVISENEDDKAIALQHIEQFNQMVDDGTAVETAKKIIAKRLNRATGRLKDDEFGKGYADRAAMMRQYGG